MQNNRHRVKAKARARKDAKDRKRRGLTLEQTRLQSEMKRKNSRIMELYKAGIKSGNMYAYESITAKLRTTEALDAGITHYTKIGVIQFSTSYKKYNTGLGAMLRRAYIPTITALKKRARDNAGMDDDPTWDEITDFLEYSDLNRASFNAFSELIDDYLSDEQIEEIEGLKKKDKKDHPRENLTWEDVIDNMRQALENERAVPKEKIRNADKRKSKPTPISPV